MADASKLEDRTLRILRAQEGKSAAGESITLRVKSGNVLILPDGQEIHFDPVLNIIIDCGECRSRLSVARLACHQGCPHVQQRTINRR